MTRLSDSCHVCKYLIVVMICIVDYRYTAHLSWWQSDLHTVRRAQIHEITPWAMLQPLLHRGSLPPGKPVAYLLTTALLATLALTALAGHTATATAAKVVVTFGTRHAECWCWWGWVDEFVCLGCGCRYAELWVMRGGGWEEALEV